MEFNFLAIAVAAIAPLLIGAVWYNPKVFGTSWMRASGISQDKLKGGNVAVIFGATLVLSFLLAFFMQFIVIHQTGVVQLIGGDPTKALPSYEAFMNDYKDAFRTFKHGALHGTLLAVFFVLPILGINALFERKSWKYILINVGYWALTLAIMGAIVSGWR